MLAGLSVAVWCLVSCSCSVVAVLFEKKSKPVKGGMIILPKGAFRKKGAWAKEHKEIFWERNTIKNFYN